MARERMVTRTIQFTEVNCMAVHLETKQVTDKTVILSGDLTALSNDKLLALANKVGVEGFALVMVQSTKVSEQLYGMPETAFMKMATLLPPRGSKE